MNIEEMREMTGQTQKAFAEYYGIPIGTLRRWEYGESTPAPYVLRLISEKLPMFDKAMKTIETESGTYYYDKSKGVLADNKGTRISIKEDLDEVKEHNLVLYANTLFESYYEAVEKFNKDCRLDKQEDIIWE